LLDHRDHESFDVRDLHDLAAMGIVAVDDLALL
jgi:hypothetical protein